MSTDPDVFDKLDSLINRHRSPGEAPSAPVAPSAGDIPVLTEEVAAEAMAVPVIPVLTEAVEKPAPKREETSGGDEELPDWLTGGGPAHAAAVPPAVAPPGETAAPMSAPHPLAELERLLVLAVERRIAPRLAGVLDVALGELLEQFRQEVDRMVKEAVTEELLHHLEDFATRQKTPPPT